MNIIRYAAAAAATLALAACTTAAPSAYQASHRPAVKVTVTVTATATRTVFRYRKHHHPSPAPAPAPASSPAPAPAPPAVSFGCKVLLTGNGGEEFNVTTVGDGTYSGPISVSFYDYPGSGDVFPGTTVYGATPVGNWQPVPAADIGASAEPSGCIASAQ